MIILKIKDFFIKYEQPYFIAGQYLTLESKVKHNSLITAVRDIHSRITVGFYDPRSLENLEKALSKSDKVIKEVASLVGDHLYNSKNSH